MSGMNATRYSHLGDAARLVVEQDDATRIRFIDEPHWIGYSKAIAMLDFLGEMLDRPRHLRTQNLLLVGEPGNGKTTIVSHFADVRGIPGQNSFGDPVKPIIMAQAPPSADEKALYISIMEHFWSPTRTSLPAARLRYQVIHMMRSCNVRMLIIDEIHSMLTGTPNKLRETMNAIKLLCNELQIPIIGVGTNDAVRVLHSDQQHSSRFDVMTLPSWGANAEFQQLLKSFEQLLPLREASRLYERESAKRLHFLCEGNIGQLSRLLTSCARDAIKRREEKITPITVERHAWIRRSNGIREVAL